MASERVFVDTWAWLCLADQATPEHDLVRRSLDPFRRPGGIITTDYVLDETITRLYSRQPFQLASRFMEKLFQTRDQGFLVVEAISAARFSEAWERRRKLWDKPRISFTDLTSFVVLEEKQIPYVLTGDAHFNQVGLQCRVIP